jgi:hypothetical protein
MGVKLGDGCFQNGVLRRIFGPNRDDVTREWRKPQNEELNNLYTLPNNVRVIKSRTRRAGHVERMGKRRGVYGFLVGKPEGRDHLGSSGSGMWRYELDRAGLEYGQMVGTCECGNEPSGSVTCGKFLD